MNRHIEKAMELRNVTPMVSNCAQTILRTYAEELGLTEDQAAGLGDNLGGGMKCGSTCGVITSGLLVLGAKGINDPASLRRFRTYITERHEGMSDCATLLKRNFELGGVKKDHCDGMIREAIEAIDLICGEEE